MIRVGVDWGSSSFRAYCFDEHGDVIDDLTQPLGIREIVPATSAQFEDVLFNAIGHWLNQLDSILLSGMITSRTGWVETDYLECPQDVGAIASHAKELFVRGHRLLFLPGIKQSKPVADVMRGEELQLLGACITHEECVVVLPGTHSKWARMNGTTLCQFRTIMTGEIFELLRHHSLVGAIATTTTFNEEAFLLGVQQGFQTTTVLSDLFSLRSSVLLEHFDDDTVHSRLSGLLIGREIFEGQQLHATDSVVLVGSDKLCSLYELAFKSVGITVNTFEGAAAVAGFRKIATSSIARGVPNE